jgi:Spy/CpxP family protein refolding chaperone
MKKLFVISIVLVATITFAAAQQGQGQRQRQTPEESAKTQTERYEKLLNLTADQKTKIQAINLELAKEMSTKMQNNQGNRENMRTIFQEIDKKRDEKFKPVLTADQFKKYVDDKEEQRKEMEARRAQRSNN